MGGTFPKSHHWKKTLEDSPQDTMRHHRNRAHDPWGIHLTVELKAKVNLRVVVLAQNLVSFHKVVVPLGKVGGRGQNGRSHCFFRRLLLEVFIARGQKILFKADKSHNRNLLRDMIIN